MLKKYNKIWNKASNIFKRDFVGEPLHNEKFLQTKVKSYCGIISTNFHDDKTPRVGFYCVHVSGSN